MLQDRLGRNQYSGGPDSELTPCILCYTDSITPKAMITEQFSAIFPTRFRIENDDELFWVYPDKLMQSKPLPETEEDAILDGFPTITSYGSIIPKYYLQIENQEYISTSLDELEQILYQWAIEEGYSWQ